MCGYCDPENGRCYMTREEQDALADALNYYDEIGRTGADIEAARDWLDGTGGYDSGGGWHSHRLNANALDDVLYLVAEWREETKGVTT